jgi:cytoskeletal protein CcmA (bactofilin family)
MDRETERLGLRSAITIKDEETTMSDTKSGLPAAPGEKKTLVEEGTQFRGSLSSNCPVIVRGRIEGDVQAPSLMVSATGAVHGKVKVDEMRSQGELAGEFDADVVQLSGTVKDNTIIRARSLEVKLTPANGKMHVVFGDCTLDVGGEGAAKASDANRDGAKAAAKASAAAPAAESRAARSVPPGEGA